MRHIVLCHWTFRARRKHNLPRRDPGAGNCAKTMRPSTKHDAQMTPQGPPSAPPENAPKPSTCRPNQGSELPEGPGNAPKPCAYRPNQGWTPRWHPCGPQGYPKDPWGVPRASRGLENTPKPCNCRQTRDLETSGRLINSPKPRNRRQHHWFDAATGPERAPTLRTRRQNRRADRPDKPQTGPRADTVIMY